MVMKRNIYKIGQWNVTECLHKNITATATAVAQKAMELCAEIQYDTDALSKIEKEIVAFKNIHCHKYSKNIGIKTKIGAVMAGHTAEHPKIDHKKIVISHWKLRNREILIISEPIGAQRT